MLPYVNRSRAYPTICADLNIGDALDCNAGGKTGPVSCKGGAKKPPDSSAVWFGSGEGIFGKISPKPPAASVACLPHRQNLCLSRAMPAQLPARNRTLLGMAALLALC